MIFFGSSFDLQEAPRVKKSKTLGLIRDALAGVRGSPLSMFEGSSKKIKKMKTQKSKIGQNPNEYPSFCKEIRDGFHAKNGIP